MRAVRCWNSAVRTSGYFSNRNQLRVFFYFFVCFFRSFALPVAPDERPRAPAAQHRHRHRQRLSVFRSTLRSLPPPSPCLTRSTRVPSVFRLSQLGSCRAQQGALGRLGPLPARVGPAAVSPPPRSLRTGCGASRRVSGRVPHAGGGGVAPSYGSAWPGPERGSSRGSARLPPRPRQHRR